MEKLRHIALSVSDPEQAAQFFEQAFGMTRAGRAMRGHNAHLGNAALRALRQASEFTEPTDGAQSPAAGRARSGAAPSKKPRAGADSRPAPAAKAPRKNASA